MKKNYLVKRCQSGIGLLEILISIMVGSILILAITTMYGNFISATKLQKQQSYAQDQANFAFLSLNRAIRMSGAGLCVRPTVNARYLHQDQEFDVFPPLLSGARKLDSSSRLHSYRNPSASDLGVGLVPMPDSDALLVIYSDVQTRRIDGIDLPAEATAQQGSRFHARKLATPRSKDDAPVFDYDGDEIRPTWVMISDCEHTGVLKYVKADFTSVAPELLPPPGIEQGFLYNFGGNGEEVLLARLHAKLFFVAKPDPQSKISNLYVRDLLAPGSKSDAKQVAAYVQRMNVEYRQGDTWIGSDARTDWNSELPVRVTLTMNAGNLSDPADEQNYTRVLSERN